jgi:hypothetical protein
MTYCNEDVLDTKASIMFDGVEHMNPAKIGHAMKLKTA